MCKSVFRNWTKNLFFWVVLILLAGANIYSISHQAGQRNEEISGHEAVYSEFKGTLTRDKILTVVKRYRQLKKIVQSQNYNHEGGRPGTYTGYYAGDYGEFQQLYDEYKYRYEYASYAKKIIGKKAATNRVKEVFAERKLTDYYDMEGPQALIEYDFYTLLCVIFVVFCSCKMICYDRKQNIYILLETCSLGMRKVMGRKILTLAMFSFLTIVFFTGMNFILFNVFYDMQGVTQPLYAISSYKTTMFQGSVLQYWLCQNLGAWTACVLIGIVSMFFATVIKEELYAMLFSMLVYLGCIAMFFKIQCQLNPVGLLAGTNLIKNRDLYGQTFVSVLVVTVISSFILIWVSGFYRVSNHS